MAELRLDSVRTVFGETVAMDDVSLTVADGEFFTLVGPSGCGKTTTLRTIAGLESPTEGEISFDGEPVSDRPIDERDVGIVFQNYALFPHMSVADNVAYGLQFTDPPDGESSDERVSELLELVDLGGFGDRDPETLSGGQRQRVALARALAPGPEILLLDEPMSALDARLRERLRRQIKRIQSELGVTTVYVTHDQAEALAVSDRLAVMHDGSLEQVGTPRAVYREPATRFVAGFLGENNLFEGRPRERSDGTVTVQVDGVSFEVADDTGGPADDANGSTDTDTGESADGVSSRPDGSATPVTVCVRPEALTVGGGQTQLTVTIQTVEFLGATARYYATWNGQQVVFHSEGSHEGTVTVGFDPEDARLV